MQKLVFIIFIYTMVINQNIQSQDNFGNLYLSGPEGIKVYIDDNLVGITKKEENGLFINSIEVGTHKLLLKGNNFSEKTYDITISSNKTLELDLFSDLNNEILKSNKITMKKKIRTDGLYVMPFGIVRDNTISSDVEGYLVVYFPSNDFENDSYFTIYLGVVTVDEGDDIQPYIETYSADIEGNGTLEIVNEKLHIIIEAQKSFITSTEAYAFAYLLDGYLSSDGMEIEDVFYESFSKKGDQFDSRYSWIKKHTRTGALKFRRF